MKILIGPDLATIYDRHRLAFLELERERYAPKFDRGTLVERFTDRRGRKWYGYPGTVQDLPLDRYARLRDFLSYMAAGLTPDEIRQLVDAGEVALASGIKTGKNAARVGLVLEELRARTQLVVHHELVLNFLAVQLVRQDEDPEKFSQALHLEKVEDLRAEVERGSPAFFLPLPESQKLRETWSWSSEEWTQFWAASLRQAERLAAVLKTASSADVSSSAARTTSARSGS